MMTNNQRWVIDTNTVVSALLFATSLPRQALDWARHHGKILQSRATIDELNLVLRRRKFDRYISELELCIGDCFKLHRGNTCDSRMVLVM